MSSLFNNNKKDFNLGYKKRPFDGYKNIVDKLDEETKRKFDRQRTMGMLIVAVFVTILVVILAVTGIGIDKNKSVSGNVFTDKESVLIECFGDSITEGYTVTADETGNHGTIAGMTYPKELELKLPLLLEQDDHTYKCKSIDVKNYGQSGSILQKTSSTRLSGSADIVIILYTSNNFLMGVEYEGTLEENIYNIRKQGAQVFLLTYPVKPDSELEDKRMQANHYLTSTAEALDAPLIDVNQYFGAMTEYSQDELYSLDDVHLTDLGYTLMGDYVAEQIHQYYYNQY